jgi:hypothetical protein
MLNDPFFKSLFVVHYLLIVGLNRCQPFTPPLPPSFNDCLAGLGAVPFKKTMSSFPPLIFGLVGHAHSVGKIINLTFLLIRSVPIKPPKVNEICLNLIFVLYRK